MQITASWLALCAKHGGPATSPIAYTFDSLVSYHSFVSIKPEGLNLIFVFSKPIFSIFA